MTRRLSIWIALAIALGAGCDGPTERFLTVQPYLYACEQAGTARLCYEVVEDSAEFRFPYFIRDFRFEWGITADIELVARDVAAEVSFEYTGVPFVPLRAIAVEDL